MKELIAAVRKKKLDIGLSTDGDADRFGIIDADGSFITPNQVLSVLLAYLKKSRGWNGCVVRSVATTHLIDKVAEKIKVPVREVPVGFKYIGEVMLKEHMLIGGEESGGLTVFGHIPEKDGVLACLLMLEMVASEKKTAGEILKGIYKEVGYVATGRTNIRLTEEGKAKLVERLKNKPPKEFGPFKVIGMNNLDGFKFLLSGASWIMIRLSGTEPLVRCYLESNSGKKLKALGFYGERFIRSLC